MFRKILYVFLISMVPIIELRGAVPVGATLGIPWAVTYAVSIVGNFIPVPFILLFIRKIFELMKKWGGVFRKVAVWFEEKGKKNSAKVTKYATFGLFLFVALPIPGTGAWMGALIAALLEMRQRNALLSIFCGLLSAALIMTLASYGIVSGLEFLTK